MISGLLGATASTLPPRVEFLGSKISQEERFNKLRIPQMVPLDRGIDKKNQEADSLARGAWLFC